MSVLSFFGNLIFREAFNINIPTRSLTDIPWHSPRRVTDIPRHSPRSVIDIPGIPQEVLLTSPGIPQEGSPIFPTFPKKSHWHPPALPKKGHWYFRHSRRVAGNVDVRLLVGDLFLWTWNLWGSPLLPCPFLRLTTSNEDWFGVLGVARDAHQSLTTSNEGCTCWSHNVFSCLDICRYTHHVTRCQSRKSISLEILWISATLPLRITTTTKKGGLITGRKVNPLYPISATCCLLVQ